MSDELEAAYDRLRKLREAAEVQKLQLKKTLRETDDAFRRLKVAIDEWTPLEAPAKTKPPERRVRSPGYLVVICDKDTNAVLGARIWSSPEWEASRHLEHRTYVAYMQYANTFQDAIDNIIESISDPRSRYHWLLAYMDQRQLWHSRELRAQAKKAEEANAQKEGDQP